MQAEEIWLTWHHVQQGMIQFWKGSIFYVLVSVKYSAENVLLNIKSKFFHMHLINILKNYTMSQV